MVCLFACSFHDVFNGQKGQQYWPFKLNWCDRYWEQTEPFVRVQRASSWFKRQGHETRQRKTTTRDAETKGGKEKRNGEAAVRKRERKIQNRKIVIAKKNCSRNSSCFGWRFGSCGLWTMGRRRRNPGGLSSVRRNGEWGNSSLVMSCGYLWCKLPGFSVRESSGL